MSETKQSYLMNSSDEHDILQLLRGFAILLVVIQHAVVLYFNSDASMIFISICVFIDVHVFMFVSGYLFEKKRDEYYKMGIKRFAAKKFRSLMIPYLFWESILYFGAFILYRIPSSAGSSLMNSLGFRKLSLTQIIVGLLTFRYSYIQLYWFLFALFWVFIINYACRSFSGRIEFMVLLFILFSVLAVILKEDDYIFTKIGRSFLTFGLGRLFNKYRPERLLNKNLILLLASFAAFYLVFMIDIGTQNAYLYKILFSFRLTLMGMIGVVIFFILSTFLQSYKTRLTEWVILLGNYSLSIYLLHNPWIVHISAVVFKKLSVPDYVGTGLSIILGLTIPILLYKYLIRKSSLLSRLMLGI